MPLTPSTPISAFPIPTADAGDNAAAIRTAICAVGNTGNETIAGTKTFSSAPACADLLVENPLEATRLVIRKRGVPAQAPELVFEAERSSWRMGVDVANNPPVMGDPPTQGGGADFVLLGGDNFFGAAVTDLIYVAANRLGDNDLDDHTGCPTFGFMAQATPDTIYTFGSPPGSFLDKDIFAIRKSQDATGKLQKFIDSDGVSQMWVDHEFKWNNFQATGNASFDHQVLNLPFADARTITSKITYTDAKDAVGGDDPLLTIVLTPGYWEIGAHAVITNVDPAAGAKLWLKFSGTAEALSGVDYLPILVSSAGGASALHIVTPDYSPGTPVYHSVGIGPAYAAVFELMHTVLKIDFEVKITLGFSQQVSTAANTTLKASSKIWAKFMMGL
jgi:hypothetical protein